MASENKKERKIYRVLIDEVNKIWERIYFLTNARSVDADDGDNLETKVGAIKGITTSTTVTEEGWAADAKAVWDVLSELKRNFQDGCSKIAAAITSNGVHTAANASPDTIVDNINMVCRNKYNEGKIDGDKKHTIRIEVSCSDYDYAAWCDLYVDGNHLYQFSGSKENKSDIFTLEV